jgi:hypothetical protein
VIRTCLHRPDEVRVAFLLEVRREIAVAIVDVDWEAGGPAE